MKRIRLVPIRRFAGRYVQFREESVDAVTERQNQNVGIGSCGLSTRGSPRTEGLISSRTGAPFSELSTGVTPGLQLGTSQLGSLVYQSQQGFLQVHSETRRANAQTDHIQGDLPQKNGHTRVVSDSTNCRPDTCAVSDSTTTRGYASATSPPPVKTTGEYSSDTAGLNIRATALVLETDGHSTKSKTNRSIHFSATTVRTDTAVGIGSGTTQTSLPTSNFLQQDHRRTLSHPNIKRPGL